MDKDSIQRIKEATPKGVTNSLLGFAGVMTAILVLPRLIRFAIRNYFFRVLAEIVAIVTFGLLAEKAAQWLSPRPDEKQIPTTSPEELEEVPL